MFALLSALSSIGRARTASGQRGVALPPAWTPVDIRYCLGVASVPLFPDCDSGVVPGGSVGFTCGGPFPVTGSGVTLTDGSFLMAGYRLSGISIGVAWTGGCRLGC